MTPEVTFVIVNYRAAALLEQCLEKVAGACDGLAHEVIVVDNSSEEGEMERIRDRFDGVRIVRNGVNLGFARAVNQGIGMSSGKYILALNPDTLLPAEGIQPLLEFADRKRASENAGVFGCRLLNRDGSLQFSKGRFPTLARTIIDVLRPKRIRKYELAGYDTASEPDWVTGACILIHRDVLDAVGPLDENFFMYYEDVDLCFRARRQGFKVFYFPATAAFHYFPHCQRRESRPFVPVEIRRSHLYFYRKHYSRLSYVLLWLLTLGYSASLIAVSPLRLLFKSDGGSPARTGAALLFEMFLSGGTRPRGYTPDGRVCEPPFPGAETVTMLEAETQASRGQAQ